MQIPNQISSRRWVAQKPFSASKERWEVSRTKKQRPDKAQKLSVVVEINSKQKETSDEFAKALNNAIFVSSLLINSRFVYDFKGSTAALWETMSRFLSLPPEPSLSMPANRSVTDV